MIQDTFFNCIRECWDSLRKFKTIICYGAGEDGRFVVSILITNLDSDIVFIDNDSEKIGKEVCGVKVYPVSYIDNFKNDDAIVLVTSLKYGSELMESIARSNLVNGYINDPLTNNGLIIDNSITRIFRNYYSNEILVRINNSSDKVYRAYNLLKDEKSQKIFQRKIWNFITGGIINKDIMTLPQYFPDEIIEMCNDKEVFVDVGSYVGDTLEVFLKVMKGKFKKYYCFEMSSTNYSKLEQLWRNEVNDDRVVLFNYGLSCQNTKVHYVDCGGSATYQKDDTNDTSIAQLRTLDSLIDSGEICDEITFVKMDIEGAEMDALQGMEKMIQRNKPKLAICIYHKFEDLWEIPNYIKSLVPEYSFLIRHHNYDHTETVLYAYINEYVPKP